MMEPAARPAAPAEPPADPAVSGLPASLRDAVTMLRELSHATTPAQVLDTFGRGMSKKDGPKAYVSLSTRGLGLGQYRITRLLHEGQVGKLPVADTWTHRERFEAHSGGLLGSIVEAGVPVRINDLDAAGDPVLGDELARYRSLMASPLFDAGEPLNWTIRLSRQPGAFTEADLEEQLLLGNLVGGTVRHVQTAQLLREARRSIDREIDRIGELQRNLLPAQLPAIPGVSMAASYQTFDRAGGDMYFVEPLGEDRVIGVGEHNGHWGLFVGDVSGHGPASAVVMAMIEAILATCNSLDVATAAEALVYVNRHLTFKRIGATFVTAWMAVYDPRTGYMQYANAGHPPPLLRRRLGPAEIDDDATEIIALRDGGGLPLGITSDELYENSLVRLRPGDTLTLYTDGITEARNPEGTFFGEAGLVDALRHCQGGPDCVVGTVMHRLRKFERGGRPQDDQTLLVVGIDDVPEPDSEPPRFGPPLS